MRILILLLLALTLPSPQLRPQEPWRLAASLLWSEAYTVGKPHMGSGVRVTGLERPRWLAASSRSIKTFRVRAGTPGSWGPTLWQAGGDLAWAVGGLAGGGNRMVGPHWVVEVKDILQEGDSLWLAWTGGVARSRDRGRTWQDVSTGLPARFVSVLARWNDRIYAGTEKGLARWNDDKGRFEAVEPVGRPIRSLLPVAGGLAVGTFRHGAYMLEGGRSDTVRFLGLAGCTVEGFARHGQLLYAATNRRGLVAMGFTGERAGTAILGAWQPVKKWRSDATSLVVVPGPTPQSPPTIFVATMGQGVQVSRDGGRSWQDFGLPGGHVTSLALYRAGRPAAAKGDPPASADPPKTTIRKWFMARAGRNPRAINFFTLRWALEDEALRPFALHRLRELLAEPAGDMFYQYPAIGAWWHCRELIPQALRHHWRQVLLAYPGYRGDTANHLCMWHTALYLTAAAFPEAGPEEWHTGRSSPENLAFARAWLEGWIGRIFRRGMVEYDSPHYAACYLGPLYLLADFAPDERMRRLAEASLHLLLADYGADHFKGIYAGAHSRIPKYKPYQMDWDAVAGLAYLYWDARGQGEPRFSPFVAFACLSGYRCPAVIRSLATDRTSRVQRFERKEVRTRWRYHGEDRNPPVFKQHFLTPWFTVGSTQGGILQPVQQHTWDASWRDRSGRARTLFTLHPYMNIFEWATFFPEDPLRLREVALATKGTYYNEDKWVGGSPHERIFQHRGTVIACYRVPDGERAAHQDAYLPAPAAGLTRVGEWLALDSDPVYAALYCSGPYTLQPAPAGGTRLRTAARPCSFVVEVSPAADWPSFRHFTQALARLHPKCDHGQGRVAHRTLGGREMLFTWPAGRFLDGKEQLPPADMLFLGPWIQSRLDSGVVRIGHGQESLTLDLPALLK